MGPFVGVVEVVCGVLVLAGLFTRFAAVPLIIDMLVGLASTKLPILLGHGYLGFAAPAVSRPGFWALLHEARVDLSMLLGSAFLLWVGAGPWALDSYLSRARAE
jgi:putative oxidoreductase